ncbi:MAG: hypothetical protein RIE08_01805 [Acidimicrobiales bacterium]
MIEDDSPETGTPVSYSPPCVIDVDSRDDQEFVVNPAILAS